MLRLARPSAEFKESYLEALIEHRVEGLYLNLDPDTLRQDFEPFVRELLVVDPTDPEKVPQTVYWGIDEEGYAGRISLRHRLNDFLRTYGGHIGYDVRPSRRRRGYATEMLRLVLEEARKLGMDQVSITCDDDNAASFRTIEAVGGRLVRTATVDGQDCPIRYYVVRLDTP